VTSQDEPGIRASVRHRNQELVYKWESIDLGAGKIARVCEGCELVRLEHRQSSGGAYQKDQRDALTLPRCAKAEDTERMVAVQNLMRPACCLVLTVSERQSTRQLRARVNRNCAIATGLESEMDEDSSRKMLGACHESKGPN
jgi:hypothetical protein